MGVVISPAGFVAMVCLMSLLDPEPDLIRFHRIDNTVAVGGLAADAPALRSRVAILNRAGLAPGRIVRPRIAAARDRDLVGERMD